MVMCEEEGQDLDNMGAEGVIRLGLDMGFTAVYTVLKVLKIHLFFVVFFSLRFRFTLVEVEDTNYE